MVILLLLVLTVTYLYSHFSDHHAPLQSARSGNTHTNMHTNIHSVLRNLGYSSRYMPTALEEHTTVRQTPRLEKQSIDLRISTPIALEDRQETALQYSYQRHRHLTL